MILNLGKQERISSADPAGVLWGHDAYVPIIRMRYNSQWHCISARRILSPNQFAAIVSLLAGVAAFVAFWSR